MRKELWNCTAFTCDCSSLAADGQGHCSSVNAERCTLLNEHCVIAYRAPYLFAAVLQQTGAGPQLLPLLADPARAAFQGLSITARHNRAFHIYPFLQASVTCFSLSPGKHYISIPCFRQAFHIYTYLQASIACLSLSAGKLAASSCFQQMTLAPGCRLASAPPMLSIRRCASALHASCTQNQARNLMLQAQV